MSELHLEVRDQQDQTVRMGPLAMTPPIDEDYWTYRVRLSETQAIVGFPKFGTIGIGFAVEDEDWNTNLPYTCSAEEIYRHIAHNKGDDAITREDCIAAIELIRTAAQKATGRIGLGDVQVGDYIRLDDDLIQVNYTDRHPGEFIDVVCVHGIRGLSEDVQYRRPANLAVSLISRQKKGDQS